MTSESETTVPLANDESSSNATGQAAPEQETAPMAAPDSHPEATPAQTDPVQTVAVPAVPGPVAQVPENDAWRDFVWNRVFPGGILDDAQRTPVQAAYLRAFQEPTPGMKINFAWIPIWRWAEAREQMLDEVTLGTRSNHQSFVRFNGGREHGSWRFEQNKFLRVDLSVRGEDPTKFVIFQLIPGTLTWIGVKDLDELSWTVIMAPASAEPWPQPPWTAL